jgi:hypothetical protein
MDFLITMCFHDLNNVGDFMNDIPENIVLSVSNKCKDGFIQFTKCDDCDKILIDLH